MAGTISVPPGCRTPSWDRMWPSSGQNAPPARTSPEYSKAWPLAPDSVVEVASPYQCRPEMRAKIRLYLSASARLVWVIWPRQQQVDVWRMGHDEPLRDVESLETGWMERTSCGGSHIWLRASSRKLPKHWCWGFVNLGLPRLRPRSSHPVRKAIL